MVKRFSSKPFGRYRGDSEYSAEAFREDILIPELLQDQVVTVDLSGSNLYGSSFLEEAFGGLKSRFSEDELKRKLLVKHDLLPSIVEEIEFYMYGDLD